MMRNILILGLLFLLSCSKDEIDINDFIGVYQGKRMGFDEEIAVFVDKTENNEILIETKWYGTLKAYRARTKGRKFEIINAEFQGYELVGNGTIDNNTIIIEYEYDFRGKTKIIASK